MERKATWLSVERHGGILPETGMCTEKSTGS